MKNRILIGPVTADPTESVSRVNKAFVEGMQDSFEMIPLIAERSRGLLEKAELNLWNLYYVVKHGWGWLWLLIWRRPRVAHYALNSGWAMERAVVFLALARWFRVGTLGHLHSGDFYTCWTALPNLRRRYLAQQLKKLDGVVVMSEGWRQKMHDLMGIPKENVFVVPNPIEKSFEDAANLVQCDRHSQGVLYVGALAEDKGVLDLIRAAECLQQRGVSFNLCLAGEECEPGMARRLQGRITRGALESSVKLAGRVSGERKIRLFREAGIFVLPSYFENLPLVLLEAAAAGLAIITTPVGAIPEYFRDSDSALFVNPGNTDQLASAMKRLLESPSERRRLGDRARQVYLERFGRREIMNCLASVYTTVVARKAVTPEEC